MYWLRAIICKSFGSVLGTWLDLSNYYFLPSPPQTYSYIHLCSCTNSCTCTRLHAKHPSTHMHTHNTDTQSLCTHCAHMHECLEILRLKTNEGGSLLYSYAHRSTLKMALWNRRNMYPESKNLVLPPLGFSSVHYVL